MSYISFLLLDCPSFFLSIPPFILLCIIILIIPSLIAFRDSHMQQIHTDLARTYVFKYLPNLY